MTRRLTAALAALPLIVFAGCRPDLPASPPPPSASTSSSQGGDASGCGAGAALAAQTSSIGLVLGNRANTQRAPAQRVACYLDPMLDRPSHVVAAVSDGRPRAVFDRRLPALPDGRRKVENKRAFVAALREALDVPATSPEADVLEALGVVVQGLRADETVGPRLVLINDNLLQTAGALPLQRGYLYADAGDVVDELRPYLNRTLGDLRGYTVVLLAPGAARPPQERVTVENRARIVALWGALLTAVGATVITDEAVMFTDPPNADGVPFVTPVPLEMPRPPAPAPSRAASCRAELTSREVAFVSDSAQFLDPHRARATIRTAAGQLVGCAGRIRLIGTTSSAGTEAGRIRVSTARARAVRAELAKALGVRPSSITAVGVGTRFDGFVNDRRPDGSLDSVKAQRNRLVIIEVRSS